MSHTNLLHYFFLLLSVFIVLTMAACGGADEKFDEDITNQFAPNRGDLPLPVMNQGTYVAPKIPPGGYPTFRWEGERPTSYNESPISAKLVKEGKILPVEERLPWPDDVLVLPLDDEVGIYGGFIRLTSSIPGKLDSLSVSGCFHRDADGIGRVPTICLLYTSPSPRDGLLSRMPSSA